MFRHRLLLIVEFTLHIRSTLPQCATYSQQGVWPMFAYTPHNHSEHILQIDIRIKQKCIQLGNHKIKSLANNLN